VRPAIDVARGPILDCSVAAVTVVTLKLATPSKGCRAEGPGATFKISDEARKEARLSGLKATGTRTARKGGRYEGKNSNSPSLGEQASPSFQ
jgi:hypothetical protein